MRRAFTVVELLVAVVVLLAVIIATSKIFNTASKVSSTGEANADVLQQGTIIEEQLRRDLERISRDGYMAIQCTVVANNVNQVISGPTAPLLNPQLDPTAILRCDQIVFYTAGTETSARWAGPGDLVSTGGGQQSRATRVSYGHGVQFPDLPNDPTSNPPGSNPNSAVKPIITGVTPAPSGAPAQVTPWTWFNPLTTQLGWRYGTSTQTAGPRVLANQPEARQWVLARKAVLLADDGGRAIYFPEPSNLTMAATQGASSSTSVFGDRSYTAPSGTDANSYYQELKDRNYVPLSTNVIPSPSMQSGWVDIAASDLGKVRRVISPTLRLSTPLQLAGNPYLTSLSTPFTLFDSSAPVPQSWPVGDSAPVWPSSTGVTAVGGNMPSPAAVGGFSSQRDRIMRGTFGVPANLQTNVDLPSIPTGFGLLGWPRSEKGIGNTDRKSEMLMSPTLVTNCSSFQVDWTWEPLTGRQTDASGALVPASQQLAINRQQTTPTTYKVTATASTILRGYEPFAVRPWLSQDQDPPQGFRPQPWFGFPDGYSDGANFTGVPAFQRLGVALAQDANASMPDIDHASSLTDRTNLHMREVAKAVEGLDLPLSSQGNTNRPLAVLAPYGRTVPVRTYTAVFGFNQDEAYTVTPDGFVVAREDYTPWPTQIRVTCTIHDPRLVLDRGREFQFVLDVPKRRRD
jgi:competence protein ComGC